jgi:hypothetical protein
MQLLVGAALGISPLHLSDRCGRPRIAAQRPALVTGLDPIPLGWRPSEAFMEIVETQRLMQNPG